MGLSTGTRTTPEIATGRADSTGTAAERAASGARAETENTYGADHVGFSLLFHRVGVKVQDLAQVHGDRGRLAEGSAVMLQARDLTKRQQGVLQMRNAVGKRVALILELLADASEEQPQLLAAAIRVESSQARPARGRTARREEGSRPQSCELRDPLATAPGASAGQQTWRATARARVRARGPRARALVVRQRQRAGGAGGRARGRSTLAIDHRSPAPRASPSVRAAVPRDMPRAGSHAARLSRPALVALRGAAALAARGRNTPSSRNNRPRQPRGVHSRDQAPAGERARAPKRKRKRKRQMQRCGCGLCSGKQAPGCARRSFGGELQRRRRAASRVAGRLST
eukprot:scaffold2195_cov430-Prasinococcus_capsulatus_cf.AAC.7